MPFPYTGVPVPDAPSSSKADNFATEMAQAHNLIISGLNRVYEVAPVVTKEDVPAFMQYSSLLASMIHHHHEMEEDIVFPVLQQSETYKAGIEKNLEQHHAFDIGFKRLNAYIAAVMAGDKEYSGREMQAILDGFCCEFVEHLNDEIPTIMPDVLHTYDEATIEKMLVDLDAAVEATKAQGLFTVLPFIVTILDMEATPRFPPLPGPVLWAARHLASWRHASWWRFAPYNCSGGKQLYHGV